MSNRPASAVSTSLVAHLGCDTPSFALPIGVRCRLVLSETQTHMHCTLPQYIGSFSVRPVGGVLPVCVYWLLFTAVYARTTLRTDTDPWDDGRPHGQPPDPNPNPGVTSAWILLL